jgi:hypothetical protein
MMQVTRAAFQAQASLNQQATDPMSHTLVRTFLHQSLSSCYLLNSMVDPKLLSREPAKHSEVRLQLEKLVQIV